MSSRVFRGLSWRLLDGAQALMWENSSFTVLICLEPTRRYESSAYFIMELGGCFACRSDAATTYDGGPMTDPWIILALMKAIAEMMSWILVHGRAVQSSLLSNYRCCQEDLLQPFSATVYCGARNPVIYWYIKIRKEGMMACRTD